MFKSRDITLPAKFCIVKAMVFPVVMCRCESWTVKKAECQRIDAFELWCWRRLLRVPWIARRSIQSILQEISPEYSLEGLILKLKLQNFGHLMRRADLFEKTLILGKIEGRRRRRRQRMRWLDGINNSMDMNLNKLWEIVEDRGTWPAAVQGVTIMSHTELNDSTVKHSHFLSFFLASKMKKNRQSGCWGTSDLCRRFVLYLDIYTLYSVYKCQAFNFLYIQTFSYFHA